MHAIIYQQDAFICINSDGSFLRPLKALVLIDSISDIIQGEQLISLGGLTDPLMVAGVIDFYSSGVQQNNHSPKDDHRLTEHEEQEEIRSVSYGGWIDPFQKDEFPSFALLFCRWMLICILSMR